MRLFIALSLPDEIREELARTQERLRGSPVRWVAPAGIHLTLQFLGEVAETVVPRLVAALAGLDTALFQLALSGLGAFPTVRQPRVVWVGVGGDTTSLAALQAAVIAATAPLGFVPEARPFRAHLTLGRARQDASPSQLRALGEAVTRAAPPAPLAWDAGTPALFQSTLTPQGSRYTRLGP